MIHLLPVTRMGGGNFRIIPYNQFSFYQLFLCRHKVVMSQPAAITLTAGRYPDHLLLFVFSSLFHNLIYISR